MSCQIIDTATATINKPTGIAATNIPITHSIPTIPILGSLLLERTNRLNHPRSIPPPIVLLSHHGLEAHLLDAVVHQLGHQVALIRQRILVASSQGGAAPKE
jgi:hypothetical protein